MPSKDPLPLVPHAAQTRAFTLIEILVVVALIGILAAFLFPAIRGGGEKANAVKCLQNLRGLQQANFLYASENNGEFVPVFANTETSADGAVTKRVQWNQNPAFIAFLQQKYGQSTWENGLLCPTALRARPKTTPQFAAYGMNFTGLPNVWSVPGAQSSMRMPRIARPSEVIAFADGLDWQISMNGSDRYAGEVYTRHAIAYRHGGNANVVFYDGHAASLPREQVKGNTRLWNLAE